MANEEIEKVEEVEETKAEVVEEKVEEKVSTPSYVATTTGGNKKLFYVAVALLVLGVLCMLLVPIQRKAASNFREEHTEYVSSYYSYYGYYAWDEDDNEYKYWDKQETADNTQVFGVVSLVAGAVLMVVYLAKEKKLEKVKAVFLKIFALSAKYMKWLDGIYDDTAAKLIKVYRWLATFFSWLYIIAGYIGIVGCVIMAIAEEDGFYLLFAIASPIAGHLMALITQVSTAISVMTINMIADVSAIRKNTDKE